MRCATMTKEGMRVNREGKTEAQQTPPFAELTIKRQVKVKARILRWFQLTRKWQALACLNFHCINVDKFAGFKGLEGSPMVLRIHGNVKIASHHFAKCLRILHTASPISQQDIDRCFVEGRPDRLFTTAYGEVSMAFILRLK